MLRCGIIGRGKFANIHRSKLADMPGVRFSGFYDPFSNSRTGGKSRSDEISLCKLLSTSDAVFICSPASTHFSLLMQAIDAGCHAYVEKPLCTCETEAREALRFAAIRDVFIQVGHQERLVLRDLGFFETCIEGAAMEFVRKSNIGDRYLDVSVAFDLMIHDLDAIFTHQQARYLDHSRPTIVSERNSSWDALTVDFTAEAGGSARLSADRRSSDRSRAIAVHQPREGRRFVFDLSSRELRCSAIKGGASAGETVLRKSSLTDPLGVAIGAFLDRVGGKDGPLVKLMSGLDSAVTAVAAADRIDNLTYKSFRRSA